MGRSTRSARLVPIAPMPIEAFNEWSKSWGFNSRGDIECFPKTEKRSAVWLPNEPNERGGDTYLCGTIDSCVIQQLPKAPTKRLAKPTLDVLRGFGAPGYRNDALNSASYYCAKARIPESEARRFCLRAAELCGSQLRNQTSRNRLSEAVTEPAMTSHESVNPESPTCC
jgi:hypothetical protein